MKFDRSNKFDFCYFALAHPILLTVAGESSNFTDYSILNKYVHTLHVNWRYHATCLSCISRFFFFHIIVCKIVKLGSW